MVNAHNGTALLITEGHVNRLKMIKRTAYGRASFALLCQRALDKV